MTAKLIPIIDSPMEAGDYAVIEEACAVLAARDDVFMARVDEIDAKLTALEHKLNAKIAQLIKAIEQEEGNPSSH
jgi:hypothetical protein